MNIPITKRVMMGGGKKGCGCGCDCECGKTPAKSMAYAAIKAANEGKDTFTYAGQERKVTAQPNSAVKMWGAAKVAHGKKSSPAKMGCYGKKK